jgi:hypothetical protein
MDRQAFLESLYLKMECFICNEVIKRMVLYEAISNIPYNLILTTKCNDSSILITIISCDYLNLSLADELIGNITIPTQVIEYNQNFLQSSTFRLFYVAYMSTVIQLLICYSS